MMKPVLRDVKKVIDRIIEIFSVKGMKSFDALKAYWKPEYQGRRINRRISHHIVSDGENANQQILYILISKFGKPGRQATGLSSEYLELLSNSILKINSGRLEQTHQNQLIQLTNDLKSDYLPDSAWRSLQFIATANGLFHIGLAFRNRMVQRVLAANIQSLQKKTQLVCYFNAAMDNQDFQRAADALKRFVDRYKHDPLYDRMKLHYHLMQGQREETLTIAQKYYRKGDHEFAQYIQGKRIAIVGPAPGGDSVADEIDNFDIVIRTNYRGRNSLPPEEEFGSKINVSFYNYTYTKQVLGISDNSFLDDLDFAVFKNEIDIKRYNGRPTTSKFRTMYQINEHIMNGKSQMVQNIIYDLLHFDPKEIKVFKSNFFMSNQRYYSTYASPSNQSQTVSNFWINFATHDLVTQLNFSRLLLHKRQLAGDNQAHSVMELSNNEYIRKIQEIYSVL